MSPTLVRRYGFCGSSFSEAQAYHVIVNPDNSTGPTRIHVTQGPKIYPYKEVLLHYKIEERRIGSEQQ